MYYICCSELDDRVVNICFIWCRDAADDILAGPSDLWMYYAANIRFFPQIFFLHESFDIL